MVNHKEFNFDDCHNNYHCTHIVNDPLWPKSVGVAPMEILEIEGVIDSAVCFKPMITKDSSEFIKLFDHYKQGRYPFGGVPYYGPGLYEQPARYIRAMEVIDAAGNSARKKKREAK